VFKKIALGQQHRVTSGHETPQPYPTDLSDREWALIQHLAPTAKPGGRPETYLKREILDAIFYILVVAVRGVCCPMTFRPGRWSTSTSGAGASTAPGSTCMICSTVMYGWLPVHSANPAPASLIASQ
jgi:hypothetical protein